ncbi:hypothetical protein CB0940_07240 [Cercospora beticola]|uniref:CsbD-like domain-containing protein n=1 Tax=Cercospora beticola TaxID=122368 RepID=A0A2G5H9I9_CERBT|nr:hypothetical protein CB0940_07240 [Cercospora beticola]PIA88973.1 hypothetical protein CB0940_07240 [Cercospora beticola]WPB03173.1 hypothetical protein RHO25_007810 [Cercospora beticola]CAK1358110.1 unnamed protein product [Cercospora beticola]
MQFNICSILLALSAVAIAAPTPVAYNELEARGLGAAIGKTLIKWGDKLQGKGDKISASGQAAGEKITANGQRWGENIQNAGQRMQGGKKWPGWKKVLGGEEE